MPGQHKKIGFLSSPPCRSQPFSVRWCEFAHWLKKTLATNKVASIPTASATFTLKPPLKWAGGKRWLVPTLREIYHSVDSSRLVEPFVGGMAITLGLRPKAALLNDTNPHIINFFKELQRGFQFDLAYGNKKDDFYLAREESNSLIQQNNISGTQAAQLFYYLIRTGYNGLCRFNKSGLFNVPFGRFEKIDY